MIDDIADIFLDLLGELFLWEKVDRYLRSKIPFRPLRWVIVSLFYVLLGAIVVAAVGLLIALFS